MMPDGLKGHVCRPAVWGAVPIALLLAACSGGPAITSGLSIMPAAETPAAPGSRAAPDLSSVEVVKIFKDKADELKLQSPALVTAPDAPPPINAEPWMICLKSGAPEQSRRLYALLFQDGRLRTTRPAAILDNCEARPFEPLNVGVLAPPPPPSKPRARRSRN